jgi:glycosyltransferase involved in cell wall biosynthesis
MESTIHTTASTNPTPLVSVIIACKNTAKYFEQCLQSVRAQTYKHIEVIVVDNFSTDGTFDIAKRYADAVYQKGPERSTQFNYGFSQSQGALIYRIGPDYVLESDLIEKCVAKIAEGYDALALHNRSVGDSIWAKVRYLERESYRNDNSIVAVRFMKREVFAGVGMFDESLVAGEDFDLHNRMVQAGYKWAHVDAVENHIGEPRNIIEVWNKFYYYGRTIRRYQQKNKGAAKEQLVFFRPSYRKIHGELLRSPTLFITFYVYMFVKYFAGFCGMVRGAPKSLPE